MNARVPMCGAPLAWLLFIAGLCGAGASAGAENSTAYAGPAAFHSDFNGLWRTPGIGGRPPGAPGLCCLLEGWEQFSEKLQPWAMQIMVRRDAALQAGKPLPTTSATCKPDGTPTVIDVPYAFEFVLTPSSAFILYETDYQSRRIRMNSTHPAQLNLSWYGDSIGYWDGETLVVDTVGLNALGQINWDGIPHTDALHVVERYTVKRPGWLELQMTLIDPGVLKEPWVITKHFQRQTETQLYEYVCAQNNRDMSVPTE